MTKSLSFRIADACLDLSSPWCHFARNFRSRSARASKKKIAGGWAWGVGPAGEELRSCALVQAILSRVPFRSMRGPARMPVLYPSLSRKLVLSFSAV